MLYAVAVPERRSSCAKLCLTGPRHQRFSRYLRETTGEYLPRLTDAYGGAIDPLERIGIQYIIGTINNTYKYALDIAKHTHTHKSYVMRVRRADLFKENSFVSARAISLI
eukprot:3274772-Pyramimonas_sp.AAC.1